MIAHSSNGGRGDTRRVRQKYREIDLSHGLRSKQNLYMPSNRLGPIRSRTSDAGMWLKNSTSLRRRLVMIRPAAARSPRAAHNARATTPGPVAELRGWLAASGGEIRVTIASSPARGSRNSSTEVPAVLGTLRKTKLCSNETITASRVSRSGPAGKVSVFDELAARQGLVAGFIIEGVHVAVVVANGRLTALLVYAPPPFLERRAPPGQVALAFGGAVPATTGEEFIRRRRPRDEPDDLLHELVLVADHVVVHPRLGVTKLLMGHLPTPMLIGDGGEPRPSVEALARRIAAVQRRTRAGRAEPTALEHRPFGIIGSRREVELHVEVHPDDLVGNLGEHLGRARPIEPEELVGVADAHPVDRVAGAQLVQHRSAVDLALVEVVEAAVADGITELRDGLRGAVCAVVVGDTDVVDSPFEVVSEVGAQQLDLVLGDEEEHNHRSDPVLGGFDASAELGASRNRR